jgi:beta-N-acetylhexosaminidase
MTRGKAAILVALLLIVVLQAINIGPTQFLGAQGWAAVLAGSSNNQRASFFNPLAQSKAAKDAKGQAAADPQRAVDTIIGQMSLDQKLGQMMMVQFVGADYSLQLSTMISQYNIGSVLLFYANGNIVGKEQVKSLTQQIQQGSTTLPIAISIDQEGGTVDRLVQLDGPRPSEASIGATNDPEKARQAGLQDAQDLTSYGINLNLAPVVDVDNLVTSEMHQDNRTYGGNPAIVSSMAGAYLKGLQQSGKVVGTLKHFPGLGYVNVDPHFGIPRLNRTKDEMEQIDWSPYRTLIQQGQVHAIMVTHEIVPAIDGTRPSSLSPQLVQGILRDEMHFQGVIMTDSLTMAGITQYYTPGQAAALAVEAGSDMIMGANSPTELATMLDGIKQAVSDGTISKARIDESVRRILMMKYQTGLLSTPKN